VCRAQSSVEGWLSVSHFHRCFHGSEWEAVSGVAGVA
jgi:hypothetical protein